MADQTIPPALTPEEWEMMMVWRTRHMIDAPNLGSLNIRWNAGGGSPGRLLQGLNADERHAFAALLLYGQPFGFTQEDADFLGDMCMKYSGEWGDHAKRLYEKVAALLPPG